MQKPTLAFVDHELHKKTQSSDFLKFVYVYIFSDNRKLQMQSALERKAHEDIL